MRRERGVTQRDMAEALGVSPAYLSALEHGRRGLPSWALVQNVIGYFNVIWDEAEELERLAAQSDPRVALRTGGLSPAATALANLLAERLPELSQDQIAAIEAIVSDEKTTTLSGTGPADPRSGR
jgi:transcriptional regulator with XRE-family HTH domain